jgi:hypothetical protein
MSRRTLGYAVAFVVLAVLVEATDFDRLNQFAVDNLQPVAAGKGHPRLNSLAELVVSPGSPAFTAVLIGAAAVVLLARRRPRGGGGGGGARGRGGGGGGGGGVLI